MTRTTTGLAAVGQLLPVPPSGGGHLLWTSTDGQAWASSVLPVVENDLAYAVAGKDGRTVVGGTVGEGEMALAWTAGADMHWSRLELLSDADVADAAAGPDGFVLVGSADRNSAARPAIWHSGDGVQWDRVGPGTGIALYGGLRHVVRTPSLFIAHGGVRTKLLPETGDYPLPTAAEYESVPWTSADGVSWAPIADVAPFAWARLDAIVAGPGRLTALGRTVNPANGVETFAAWTSADGLAWHRVDVQGMAGVSRVDVAAANASGHIAAFATEDIEGGLLAISDDAARWNLAPRPLPDGSSVRALVGYGDGYLAAGQGPGVLIDPDDCPVWRSP